MQSLLLSRLLHIQMLHSHHACLPSRRELIVLISLRFDPFSFFQIRVKLIGKTRRTYPSVSLRNVNRSQVPPDDNFTRRKGFCVWNFFFPFVSGDSITVANAALEYKLKSLVTDTL